MNGWLASSLRARGSSSLSLVFFGRIWRRARTRRRPYFSAACLIPFDQVSAFEWRNGRAGLIGRWEEKGETRIEPAAARDEGNARM